MAQTGTVRRFDAEGWSSRGGRDTPPRSYDDPRRSAPRTAPGDATTGSGDGNGSGYRPGERWRPTQNRIAPRGAPPEAGPGGAVERAELAPLMAGDGSALPSALWAGLDVAQIEQLLAALTIPPRSPALHNLWRRLITARVDTPAGTRGNDHFDAIRLEALYRSGLIAEISEMLTADRRGDPTSPIIAMMRARSEIGLGRRDAGCDIARRVSNIRGEIPKSLRGEAILVSGYCAAAQGNPAAAGLMAALAREEGVAQGPGLMALDAIAAGQKPEMKLAAPGRLTLVDYRILQIAGVTPDAGHLVPAAAPALLVAILLDPVAKPELRLAAGEAAARLNAIDPKALGALYRELAGNRGHGDTLAAAAADGVQSPSRRALLFTAAEAERTPFKRVRLIRSLLDSARQAGLYAQTLVLAAALAETVGLVPEVGWFAETAIEANLAAGSYAKARMWVRFAASLEPGRNGLGHWMALADIADPDFPEERGAALADVERLAFSGRIGPDMLHRLATVLDALNYQVPIPLWELASRTPQPSGGHLPETGVLTRLQSAAKERAFGRTVLLAMQTLGQNGAEGAHMIALGDAIRALARAGLEADARRLGLEALLGGWPRATSN